MVKAIPQSREDGLVGAERRRALASAESTSAVNPKVVAARVRRWRRHLVRVGFGLAGLGLLLCAMVVYQRDQTRVNEAVLRVQPFVPPLQNQIKRIGMLPIYYPYSTPNLTRTEVDAELTYPSPETITQLRKFQGPVLLAPGKSSPRLFLQRRGRPALMVDGQQLTLKWVTHAELALLQDQRDSFVQRELKKLTSKAPELP